MSDTGLPYGGLVAMVTEDGYPNGVCPLMSTVQVVPAAVVPDAGIVSVHNQQSTVVQVPVLVPCLGTKCQVWNRKSGGCSFLMAYILEE